MNYILKLFSISWIVFVMYSLLKGSKIEFQTNHVRKTYWTLTGISFALIIYLTNDLNTFTVIWMAIMILITMLYASIPSGFNSKGIYIRGMYYPYSIIQNLKGEYVMGKYRINFMARNIQMYIETNEENDNEMKRLERYYKESKQND